MTKHERDEITLLLGGLAEVLGKAFEPGQLSLLLDDLEDIPAKYLKPAIALYRRTGRFLPAPVDLRELAMEEARRPKPLHALPAIDAARERARIMATWHGREEEVRRDIDRLAPGVAREVAEAAARAAKDIR